MAITTEQIKELRQRTNISIAECKKALEEAGGDLEKALAVLREAGAKVAEKKSQRQTSAGVIDGYVHSTKQIGALVEVRCETDFVARNEDFQEFTHDLAMHITASDPSDTEDLLGQIFIKDSGKTIADYVKEVIQKFGENIEISRFSRFSLK